MLSTIFSYQNLNQGFLPPLFRNFCVKVSEKLVLTKNKFVFLHPQIQPPTTWQTSNLSSIEAPIR